MHKVKFVKGNLRHSKYMTNVPGIAHQSPSYTRYASKPHTRKQTNRLAHIGTTGGSGMLDLHENADQATRFAVSAVLQAAPILQTSVRYEQRPLSINCVGIYGFTHRLSVPVIESTEQPSSISQLVSARNQQIFTQFIPCLCCLSNINFIQ